MAKAIITGAGGMIGLAITRQLLKENNDVVALVRPGSERASRIPKSDKVKIIECAQEDYANFEPDEKGDVFYHLAWTNTTVLGRDDIDVQQKNIQYSLDAAKLAKRFGCSVFVGAGSQAEYGIVNEKLSGKTPVNPQSGYGIAKYTAGRLTAKLCAQMGIRQCWARIVSAYGLHDGINSLIMYVTRSLLNGITPELTECRQIWDYMYCDDIADAFIAIANHGVDGKAYCLGTGNGRPLYEYVNDIKDCINKEANIIFGAKQYYPYQPMYLVADATELKADTGFSAKTSFKSGIANIVNWMKGETNGK